MPENGDEIIDPEEGNEDASSHDDESIKAQLVRISRSFSGPIPPPDIFRQYGDIIPNAPERILTMAEQQLEHRSYLERTVIESDAKRSQLGLILGFIIGIVMIIGGIILLLLGKDLSGFAIITIPLASIVGTFIYSRRERQKNLDARKGDFEKIGGLE